MNPKQIEEFFHLSPLQKHLLRQSEQAAEANSYLAQFGCYLTGKLDVSAFERAWQKVTNRQPGLRLTFVSGDLKEPVQIVNRGVSVDLEKHDWRNLTTAEQERRLDELLQADRQCGLVLKQAPLWRMVLIRLSDEQAYFVWSYHELLFDEHSLPLILNEVLASYTALLQGKNETLPLPPSFRKYVEWCKKKNVEDAEAFWRAYLRGLTMPTTIELGTEASAAQLSVTAVDRLKLLAAAADVSLDVIVQGAWALLLSRLSGQRDVLFGSTVSGRPSELHGADRIIGHFSQALPLRVQVAFEQTVQQYLRALQTAQQQWHQYEHNSLTQVQAWSALPADLPLFQSALVFDGAELEGSLRKSATGLEVSPERLILPNDFALTIVVKEDAQGWQITCNEAYAALLCYLLEQFAQDASQRLDAIAWPPPLLLGAEPPVAVVEEEPVAVTVATLSVDAVAAPPSQPAPPLPLEWLPVTAPTAEDEQGWVTWLKSGDCVHEVFEARTAKMPDAVTVRCPDGELTYQELNARANQLARYLHKLNVLPSIPVGLCFAHSVEAVVALLGVLKAGGAYLPLDAELSAANLQEALAAHATTVLLTQAGLEPKFRALPMTTIVLCLDSDWLLIAEEARSNPAFQVGDEHPACYAPEAVITHATLARDLTDKSEWFGFGAGNPWHLFRSVVPVSVVPPLVPPVPPAPPVSVVPSPEVPAPSVVSAPEVTEPVVSGDSLLADLLPELIELEGEEPLLELEPWSELLPNGPAPVHSVAETVVTFTTPTLAPIQQAFLAEHPLEPQHGNVSLLVEINEPLEQAWLEQAVQTIIAEHEALRWRFTKTGTEWQRSELPVSAVGVPFEYVDFSAKWARSQRRAIEETAAKMQTSLHLSDGPLWRVAYFDLGANRAHRLLVIFHQLLGDAASLRIFLTDLLETYWQLSRQQTLVPPLPRPSYTQWLQATQANVGHAALAYWQQLNARPYGMLPSDHTEGASTYGQMDRVFVSLNSAETEALLQHVPHAAQAEINELVLTALAAALVQWTNNSRVLIEAEHDVRPLALAGLDMTRTLGWFTARFPLGLEFAASADIVGALHTVQTCWRALPEAGLSYGWLRYHSDAATRAAMQALPTPQIRFRTLSFAPEPFDWHLATESVGVEVAPQNECRAMITVTGALNLNMLEFQWNYARTRFEQRTIGVLVNSFIAELRQLIHHYSQQKARG